MQTLEKESTENLKEKAFPTCPNDKYLHSKIKLNLEDIYRIQKCIFQHFVYASRMKIKPIKDHPWLYAAMKKKQKPNWYTNETD